MNKYGHNRYTKQTNLSIFIFIFSIQAKKIQNLDFRIFTCKRRRQKKPITTDFYYPKQISKIKRANLWFYILCIICAFISNNNKNSNPIVVLFKFGWCIIMWKGTLILLIIWYLSICLRYRWRNISVYLCIWVLPTTYFPSFSSFNRFLASTFPVSNLRACPDEAEKRRKFETMRII